MTCFYDTKRLRILKNRHEEKFVKTGIYNKSLCLVFTQTGGKNKRKDCQTYASHLRSNPAIQFKT